MNTEKVENKIDNIEKIVLENKSDIKILTKKIDEVIANQQRLKHIDVDALEEFVANWKILQQYMQIQSLLVLIWIRRSWKCH